MIYLDENKNIEIHSNKIILYIDEKKFSNEAAILASNSLADSYDVYLNYDKNKKMYLEIYSKKDNLKEVANEFYKRLLSYQSYLIFQKKNKEELELMSYYLFDDNEENKSDEEILNSDEDDTESIFAINPGDEEIQESDKTTKDD